MNCLITGCAIVDRALGRWRWGDLHEEGSCFIHYCIQEDWNYEPVAKELMAINIDDAKPYFDECFVLGLCAAKYSREYLAKQNEPP
jgi:hypothetical protein